MTVTVAAKPPHCSSSASAPWAYEVSVNLESIQYTAVSSQ
jgi:hypothetical protein